VAWFTRSKASIRADINPNGDGAGKHDPFPL
jgi:hypothetical protein